MDPIHDLLHATSRTFALGIEQLPPGLRRPIGVAYLLLRVSDYFEDNEVLPPDEKVRYLERWVDALEGRADADAVMDRPEALDPELPDAEAVRQADVILEAYRELPRHPRDVLCRHVSDSTRGMARWVVRGPDFADEDDLDDYMFEVAGRVGLLLTELFAAESPAVRQRFDRMMELGREFGLGLQTVNVIRGLSTDPDRGWVYVPRAWAGGGESPEAFWADPGSPASRAVLDRLVEKAEGHLEAARDYVLGIPRRHHRIRIFCLLPLFFAVRTLAMSRGNPAVYLGEVKMTRKEVRSIAARTRLLGWSNRWVRAYCAKLGGANGNGPA